MGHVSSARGHYARTARMCDSLGNVPARLELSRSWRAATSAPPTPPVEQSDPRADLVTQRHSLLQSAAFVLLHAGRPDLVACELVDLLANAGCVEGAVAIARDAQGEVNTLATTGEPPQLRDDHAARLEVGTMNARSVEVLVTPKSDLESAVALNAVKRIVTAAHELDRARAEREDRLALWPLDELTADENVFVGGQMRELLAIAKRVAN